MHNLILKKQGKGFLIQGAFVIFGEN